MNGINEKELDLVVSKQELGTLETNAKVILEKVKEVLPNYSAEYYNEDNIDIAKADKALLNKTAKVLNDKRIELEKQFNEPFEVFKATIKETTGLIKDASSKIDGIVKDVENKAKEERKKVIVKVYEENIKELKEILPLEKIFEERWLNKGSFNSNNEFKLKGELIEEIDKVRRDLLAISELHSNYEVELKNDYLEYFDLSRVIAKNNELINKEELLKTQKEESEKVVEQKQEEKMQEMASTKVQENVVDEVLTYTLKITGKTSQMKALRKFLETNEMTFEKVEL